MEHQIKLTQLYHIDKLEKEQKLEFVNQIDINYSFPQSTPKHSLDKLFLGYSPLHIAVDISSLDLVSEFIRHGASTVKQEAKKQRTPLHLIIDHVNYDKKSIHLSKERHSLANALLSGQIQSNISINPKCNDGISHFHVACLFNHTAAIEFFIKIGESIDQMTNIGLTPLHCAIKSASFDAAKILLSNGADINLKDMEGTSSLVLLGELLMEANDLMTIGKCVPTVIYEDDINEIESVFMLIIKLKMNDPIFSNDSKLTVVHMACMLKNTSILKNHLEKGFDFHRPLSKDSEFWPGWTPLHFAACCNVESFDLLIKNGADINAKNKTGETPLDLFAMRNVPKIVQESLSRSNELKSILFSDCSTQLSDVLQAMNSSEEFNNLLTSWPCANISISRNSLIWPDFSLLHLSLVMNEKTMEFDERSPKLNKVNLDDKSFICIEDEIVMDFDETMEFDEYSPKLNKVNPDDQRYNCTEDEIALYMKRIKICLERGCNVSMKNADGLTPIHLAFRMNKVDVVKKMLNYCQEDAVDPQGLSHFHIACAMGDQNAVELLLSKGVDMNSPAEHCFESFETFYFNGVPSKRHVSVKAQSTPLHIAVTYDNHDVAKYLTESGADVFAKDARGLTPIHLSMRCHWSLSKWLFDRASNHLSESKNVVSPAGISYLFIAAHVDDDNAIEKLLRNGAQVDVTWPTDLDFLPKYSGLTPLHLAVKEGCDKAVRALIAGGANIFLENPYCELDSPLQRSFDNINRKSFKYFADELRRNDTSIAALDSSGLTQLHLACGSLDFDWAEDLLDKGANVNAIMSRDKGYEANSRVTPLLVLFHKSSHRQENPQNFIDLLRLLIGRGADVTIDYKTETPLYFAYTRYLEVMSIPPKTIEDYIINGDDIEDEPLPFLQIADLLLRNQKSYDVNPKNNYGFSHFHYACLRNNLEIVKKFLDNDVDVNQTTSFFLRDEKKPGFSPLHFAFAHRSKEVIPLLIEGGADVTAENAHGNTPLHIAIIHDFVNLELFDKLLSQGANINAKNVAGETPLRCLLNRKDLTIEKLEFFIGRGATIDVSKTESIAKAFNAAIENATSNEVVLIYKRLLNAYDVEPVINSCFNPIHSIVTVYDESRTLDFYLDTIKQFLALDCELNWQDEDGKTALHKASTNRVYAAVEALLILGADANIVDKSGRAPLNREMVASYIDEGQYDHEWDDGSSLSTISKLAVHAWKMKMIRLDVVNSFAEAVELAEESYTFIDENSERTCQNELVKLESLKIDQVVPLKKFVSEWGAVIEYPTMPFAHREIVDEYFTDTESLSKEFPEFCGLLMMQYRRALDRVKLLKSAKHVIISECEIDFLPDLCLEAIFIYFKNDDLRILIADSDEILHPCKRQKI